MRVNQWGGVKKIERNRNRQGGRGVDVPGVTLATDLKKRALSSNFAAHIFLTIILLRKEKSTPVSHFVL